MNNSYDDPDASVIVVGLATAALLGIAGAVLVARAVLPTIQRVAAVDLRAVVDGFAEFARHLSAENNRLGDFEPNREKLN